MNSLVPRDGEIEVKHRKKKKSFDTRKIRSVESVCWCVDKFSARGCSWSGSENGGRDCGSGRDGSFWKERLLDASKNPSSSWQTAVYCKLRTGKNESTQTNKQIAQTTSERVAPLWSGRAGAQH